jgi:hypothetical protein
MEPKNFHKTITVNASPKEAFDKIAKVGDWWAKTFTGKALHQNDTFRVSFDTTWVDFKVTEAIPDKKAVWYVTDCYLPWLNDKTEWKDTQVVFNIAAQNGSTKIDFTHVGLVPGIECYSDCEKGWTKFVTESLPAFIEKGVGIPQ